ncbi:MAG: MOSC domain-containing protein [Vulcanimicrobiaceae bacterium]
MEGTPLGTLAGLWRYPTKALRGEALESAEVTHAGIAGDRARALFVRDADHPRAQKTYRGKEDRRLHLGSDPLAFAARSADEGLALTLESEGPYFDDEPLSLVLDCWLRELERLCGLSLDRLRFRPNLFVHTLAEVGDEPELIGARVTAREVVLRIVAPIRRCVTITYDQNDGTPAPAILEAVARDRENVLGVYAHVEVPGRLTRGERLSLVR